MTEHRDTTPRRAADPDSFTELEEPTLAQRAIEAPVPTRVKVLVPFALAAVAVVGVGMSALAQQNSDGLDAQPAANTASAPAHRKQSSVSRDQARPALSAAPQAASSIDVEVQVGKPIVTQVKMPAAPKTTPSKAPTKAAPTYPTSLGPVIGTRYLTTALNARTAPVTTSPLVTVIAEGRSVKITANVVAGFRQISHNGKPVWVKDTYLTKTKPSTSTGSGSGSGSGSGGGGISGAPCASGSGVESGLTSNAIRVHRAVCARFPGITGYGGVRGSADEHGSGRALDIMISGSAGWEVARWVRANAGSLGVTEVIYSQSIWTTQRSGEGWRPMSDRGSTTANHYDHVHVTVG